MKLTCCMTLCALLVLQLLGCGSEAAEEGDVVSSASLDGTGDGFSGGVTELTHLHGLAESEVLARLGEPDYEEEHVLRSGETLPEFYIEVHNTYQPDDPSTEGVVIRHLEWDYGWYSKAIFMHRPDSLSGEWIVLESVQWSDDVEF